MKKAFLIGFVLILAAALIVGFFLWRGSAGRIGRDRALEIALNDAGLTRAEVRDVSVDFERENSTAFYEVSFEQGLQEYEYAVDAASGKILYGGRDR